jgi:hypothetical protein
MIDFDFAFLWTATKFWYMTCLPIALAYIASAPIPLLPPSVLAIQEILAFPGSGDSFMLGEMARDGFQVWSAIATILTPYVLGWAMFVEEII